MNVTEAHNQLNEWYPGRSHHIGIQFWYFTHGEKTTTEIKYTASVHNPHIQADKPILGDCIRELAPKPTLTDDELLKIADSAIQEVAELANL